MFDFSEISIYSDLFDDKNETFSNNKNNQHFDSINEENDNFKENLESNYLIEENRNKDLEKKEKKIKFILNKLNLEKSRKKGK